MTGIRNFPSLAADVDPATADVPVGGYVCGKDAVSRSTARSSSTARPPSAST